MKRFRLILTNDEHGKNYIVYWTGTDPEAVKTRVQACFPRLRISHISEV